jgi:hypothetical protein
MLVRDWRAAVLGLPIGIAIAFLNCWLSDRFLDPLIAEFQGALQKVLPMVIVNLVAFAWALALSALSMLAPVVILGNTFLAKIR